MPDGGTLFWLFFRLSGRVGRAAFFLGGTFVWLVQIFLLYRFSIAPEGSATSQAFALTFTIAILLGAWSNFALTAKRFHDLDRPTAFAVVSLLAGYILVIALSFVPGDPGPNRYGARTDAPA